MAALRQVCRNVKRWRDGRMALRWTGTAPPLEGLQTAFPILRAIAENLAA